MRKIVLGLLLFGCGDFIEMPDDARSPELLIAEKSRACEASRVRCEQTCFYDHGQFLGTFSIRYNRCMAVCEEEFEHCLLRPRRIPGSNDGLMGPTYSWDQPPSDGIGGYYGYCGPTAVSNLIANVCGDFVNPYESGDRCFSLGPGASPSDMVDALNEFGDCGRFALCEQPSGETDRMAALEASLPAAVLLDWDSLFTLHWVTVVHVDWGGGGCDVVFNHWGRQETMACSEFVERWSLTRTNTGAAAILTRVLDPFTYICRQR
jgi:hypothetical protein